MSGLKYNIDTGKLLIGPNGKLCTTCCGGWPNCQVNFPPFIEVDIKDVILCTEGPDGICKCWYTSEYLCPDSDINRKILVPMVDSGPQGALYKTQFGGQFVELAEYTGWAGYWEVWVYLKCAEREGKYVVTAAPLIFSCDRRYIWSYGHWIWDPSLSTQKVTSFPFGTYAPNQDPAFCYVTDEEGDPVEIPNMMQEIEDCGDNYMGIWDNFVCGYGGFVIIKAILTDCVFIESCASLPIECCEGCEKELCFKARCRINLAKGGNDFDNIDVDFQWRVDEGAWQTGTTVDVDENGIAILETACLGLDIDDEPMTVEFMVTDVNSSVDYCYEYNRCNGCSQIIDPPVVPIPDPSTWATRPYTVYQSGHFYHKMTATTAISGNPCVADGFEYLFECTTHSAYSSGWQSSSTWQVQVSGQFDAQSYRTKSRDADHNETAWSTIVEVDT